MDARSLRELGLLDVARLYGLDLETGARAAPTPALHALVTECGRWMVLGEGRGDGARPDDSFAGAAGKLLDAMLAAAGCRRGGEVAPLERQWQDAAPRVLLALGQSTAARLLGTDASSGDLRGRVHRYREVPVVVTYGPADLLDAPADKARAWEDLVLARRMAAGT